ncbi:hypothetical protein TYRP_012521 [Tyrophagus putrescentiae]|nr:hypothetical protein TYRP_012521 [Tyrophagus putrescentiae]
MDSGLCVSMRAAQGPASLKTKSTEWTLAPRRGARCRTLVLGRSAGHEVGDEVWQLPNAPIIEVLFAYTVNFFKPKKAFGVTFSSVVVSKAQKL